MNATNRKGIGRMDRRLSAYATLAGVALATPAIETADAFIIWSGPVNITIPSTTAGIYLNVVTGVFNSSPAAGPWVGMLIPGISPH